MKCKVIHAENTADLEAQINEFLNSLSAFEDIDHIKYNVIQAPIGADCHYYHYALIIYS